jgi:hypothetical protein
MILLFLLPLVWLALVAGLLIAWRTNLLALWQEPIFKAPVLIIESDDWGAGPLTQAEALAELAVCLNRHHDVTGRPACMTLALILAIPKPELAGRISLADAEQTPILTTIHSGQAQGVFALQLHGMMHFWPDSVKEAAREQPEVRIWLNKPELTEQLPSHLQSRWTNAAYLPSKPHTLEEIQAAVAEEVALFKALFRKSVGAPSGAIYSEAARSLFAPEGAPTDLGVVPPTFVWDSRVEAAWANQGVAVVITPGRRLTCRDADGKPGCQDKTMLNGDRGAGAVIYLVRDDYFEPVFGHRPEQALAALARKTALGRPCLLETHRSNFLTEAGGNPTAALAALDDLYTRALSNFPNLRFATPAELGRAIRTGDANWIEQDRRCRFTIWLRRIACLPRFGKAARLTGLLPLLNLFARSELRL